ncbi:class V chitinase CHIT5a-like [Cornus florida]|uniref:class V chitinase CHIT5a-like n=1 Tax=Cornus florida TaxID=4283 RepID=UPI00289E14D5|nr:class V chitinase CHIT5a-like [Cornus florida]
MAGRKLVAFFLAIIVAEARTIVPNTMVLAPPFPRPVSTISPSPAPMSSPAPTPSASPAIKGGYWISSTAESSPPSTIPTSYFTHLFYAFSVPDPTTYQLSITQADEKWMGNFTSTLHAKSPPALTFLAIAGDPNIFSNMSSNRDNRASFIQSSIAVAREYGFDGLNLDWEFPNNPQEMSNMAILFSEWRSAIDKEALASGSPRLLLSAAVYFASNFFLSNVPRTYPGDAIDKYADFVSPMCYDYHGAWDTSVTGAQALLYDKSSNLSTSYGISSWIKNGVAPEKLVMGLPMYGRTWKLKDPNEHGIGAPAVGAGPGFQGVMVYSDIVDYNLANSATVVYDEGTVSTYAYAGTDWIGYDGEISISNKVRFASAQGLGGYFFWAVGYDKNWTLSRAG